MDIYLSKREKDRIRELIEQSTEEKTDQAYSQFASVSVIIQNQLSMLRNMRGVPKEGLAIPNAYDHLLVISKMLWGWQDTQTPREDLIEKAKELLETVTKA